MDLSRPVSSKATVATFLIMTLTNTTVITRMIPPMVGPPKFDKGYLRVCSGRVFSFFFVASEHRILMQTNYCSSLVKGLSSLEKAIA